MRGKHINRKCIRDEEENLVDMKCNELKERDVAKM
jgi:hypothetical protein